MPQYLFPVMWPRILTLSQHLIHKPSRSNHHPVCSRPRDGTTSNGCFNQLLDKRPTHPPRSLALTQTLNMIPLPTPLTIPLRVKHRAVYLLTDTVQIYPLKSNQIKVNV